jgi:tetratricopeptide (TPR) repeat protein
MAKQFEIEWDFYLQAFRLHQKMTKGSNRQARDMLCRALNIAHTNGREFPRADGLLSFTDLTAHLNDWVDQGTAEGMLAEAKADIARLDSADEMQETHLAAVVKDIKALKGGEDLTVIVPLVVAYYATKVAAFDASDFDNHWSAGTGLLYAYKDCEVAIDHYEKAIVLAEEAPAAAICIASLKVDKADALFYCAPLPDDGRVAQAIALAEEAIANARKDAPDDPKRFRWNWTLGWAYYEADRFAESLVALQQIRNPHDLILKNIIASYVGLGKVELAIPLAAEFMERHPTYTLDVEDRWPYSDARRKRWKTHLKAAGLPGEVSSARRRARRSAGRGKGGRQP